MKKIALIVLFIVLSPLDIFSGSINNEKEENFYKANQNYKNGNYQEALNGYLKLIDSGYINGHLFYNLGNAYFRLNSLGHTILYYEKAKILLPRDSDLDFNLRYVRQETKDIIEDSSDIISTIFFWISSLTRSELSWIFAVMNLVLWTILIIRLFSKQEWTYYLLITTSVFWLLSGLSFGWKFYKIETDNRAVVIADEINVLSGPETGDTILFKLHAGAIVYNERTENRWMLISLPDKKRGWVQTNAMGLIKHKD